MFGNKALKQKIKELEEQLECKEKYLNTALEALKLVQGYALTDETCVHGAIFGYLDITHDKQIILKHHEDEMYTAVTYYQDGTYGTVKKWFDKIEFMKKLNNHYIRILNK